jgi:ArpU family phage transcriptional regulator
MFFNINDKESTKRAKKVLNSFRRLDRIARASYNLKSSANYQQTNTKGTRQPGADHEKHLLKALEAEQERDRIKRTAESLDEPYKSLLVLKFCQREKLFNWEIQEQLGYGATRFYELQNEAFLQFAECFKGGELLTFRTD